MPKHNPRLALQFLARPSTFGAAASTPAVADELSQRATFAEWQIHAHPALGLTQHTLDSRSDRELLCLGTLIDPRAPASSNRDIVERLFELASFAELEASLSGLGGRWLLLVRLNDESRVYGDAGGLRTCFYTATAEGVSFGSQPALLATLAGREPASNPREGLERSAHADSYPLGVTPYDGVQQLLPNHFLDLGKAERRRYWPLRKVPQRSCDEAARGIVELLRGSIHALALRCKLALPLTGGYDSRALLAAAWEVRDQLECFTVVDLATPAYDFVLPLRLARAFGLKHAFVRTDDATQAGLELLVLNTGGVWRDPNEQRILAFGKPQADVALLGNVSEVIRAGFYEYGNYPEHVDAALLARLSGWQGDPAAIEIYDRWLQALPPDSDVHVLDLFYWEQRVGGWAALDSLATDTFIEVISPYNCRDLLTLGLGVPLADRSVVAGAREESCRLHRRVCELAAPETLKLPFNDGWLGRVIPILRSALPGSMRGWLGRVRRTARGLTGLGIALLASELPGLSTQVSV